MRVFVSTSLLVLALAAPAAAQDAIDLRLATIERSASDVATWPIVTAITRLELGAGDCGVEFDKKAGFDKWPNVPIPGWNGGAIQYTLWMVRIVNGQVYTGGGIEFWDGRVGGCGPAAEYIKNWYYDSSWGPLHDAGELTPGERVGFFVTAGDARAKDVRIITARSAVVAVPWPGGAGGTFTFGPVAPPPVVTPPPVIIVPPPVPVPAPAPTPAPLPSTDLSGIYTQLAAISAKVDAVDQHVAEFREAVRSKYTAVLGPILKYGGAIAAGILAHWGLAK